MSAYGYICVSSVVIFLLSLFSLFIRMRICLQNKYYITK